MNIKRIIIPLLLIMLLASTIAFGSNIPLGPYFDDTYFDLSGSALILKVVVHEKGGLEADVSAYDGLIKITGGATSNLTIGIGDNNIVEMDDVDAAIDDYCKLTVNGIVGREYSEVKTDLSLNLVANLKVKLDATGAPTVNNDVDEGYTIGSRWLDVTNDKEYVCLDNTDGAAVWTETTGAAGGYTDLVEFVDQTAWRVFYSNAGGDVIELPLGADGTYLGSNGATSAPSFNTPAGAGDMLKATYDTEPDDIIDPAAGGTGVANAATETITLAGDDAIIFTTTAATNVTLPTTGTLSTLVGDEVLTNKDINFVNALGTDHFYSGELDSQPVGENVVFGEILYYDWTQVEWMKAQADDFASAKGTRIALESKADGQVCLMLVKGYIRDDSAFDFGAARVFLNDDTAGTCDDTAPAESGDQIFVVGEAKSADILFFDPGKDVGEI